MSRPLASADPSPAIFKDFRAKFSLTQSDAAAMFGVHQHSWASWEKGLRPQAAARLLCTLLLAKPELIKLFLEGEQ